MTFIIKGAETKYRSSPNFSLLEQCVCESSPAGITGMVTLHEPPLLGALRLVFVGSGAFEGIVYCGTAISRAALEFPALGFEISQSVNAFYRQVSQVAAAGANAPVRNIVSISRKPRGEAQPAQMAA